MEHVYGMIACAKRGGINKISYDNLATILKAGVPYLSRVNLKRTIHFFDKAPIQNIDRKMFIRSFANMSIDLTNIC